MAKDYPKRLRFYVSSKKDNAHVAPDAPAEMERGFEGTAASVDPERLNELRRRTWRRRYDYRFYKPRLVIAGKPGSL